MYYKFEKLFKAMKTERWKSQNKLKPTIWKH